MEKLLFITDGVHKGKCFPVGDEKITIGRDRKNLFSIDDEEVSRFHCEITSLNQDVFIEDLLSSNGTFVNGSRVWRAPLKQGDSIRIGNTRIRLDVADDPFDQTDLTNEIAQTETVSRTETISETNDVGSESTFFEIVADRGSDEASRRFVQINNDLRFLYRASLATSRKLDAIGMLSELMDLIFDWIEADQGYIFLKNNSDSDYSVRLMKRRGTAPDSEICGTQTYQSIVDYVLEKKVGVMSRKPTHDPRWRVAEVTAIHGASQTVSESESNEMLKCISEVMCVPIQGGSELLGLIYVDVVADQSSRITTRFNEDHLRLMLAMAHQAAVAIENQKYVTALIEKERMAAVGETATLMSHRINNILQGINGGSHLVEVGLERNDIEMVTNGWKIVSGNQAKISKLIRDLLILGKPFEPNKSEVEFVRLALETVSGLSEFLKSTKTEIEIDPAECRCAIEGDENALRLAVENIVRVVASACEKSAFPKFSIVFEKSGRLATMSIEYQGAGICLDADEFANSSTQDNRQITGGIEFAVAKKIIGGHDGELSLVNLKEGRYQVSITLPCQ